MFYVVLVCVRACAFFKKLELLGRYGSDYIYLARSCTWPLLLTVIDTVRALISGAVYMELIVRTCAFIIYLKKGSRYMLNLKL